MLAEEKLREAEYFLGQMKANTQDPDAFRWNLSAFLSAARSVTFYLQKEFRGNPDFDSWYPEKQALLAADTEAKYFDEARVSSIHVRAVSPRKTVDVRMYESVGVSESFRFELIREGRVVATGESHSPPSPPPQPKPTEVEISYFFADFPGGEKEVLQACEEHVTKLRDLLEDWSACDG